MKTIQLLIAGAILTTTLTGQDVIRDYDRSVNVSQYKTFDWVERKTIPIIRVEESTDPRLSSEVLNDQIRSLVEKELEKKGYRKATNSEPDFRVSYVAIGKYDLSSSAWAATYSPQQPYGHWRPFYDSTKDHNLQRSGTLTLDFVDGAENKLIWRGTARDTFNKPKDAPKKIDKAIKKIFKKFPKSK